MRDRGGGLELDPLEQSLAREQGAVQRSTVENGSVVGDQLCAAGLAPSAAASANGKVRSTWGLILPSS